MPTSAETTALLNADPHGVAPGVIVGLLGKTGTIKFSGYFYAEPEKATTQFYRAVRVIFASKDILVTQDVIARNLYVIDRNKNLSLGCLMQAEFREVEF